MHKGQPDSNPVASRNSRPRQADTAADADFVWPPTSADLAGCSIVPLGDDATVDVEGWTAALTVDTTAPVLADRPRRPIHPTPPTVRRRAAERREPRAPFGADLGDFAPDPWSAREIGRAAVALCVAASLAAVTFTEFRGTRSASLRPAATAARIASVALPDAAAALAIATPSNSARTNVEEAVSLVRGMSMPEARIDVPRVAAAAIVPVTLLSPEPIVQPDAPRAIDTARVETRPLLPPAPADVPARNAAPAPSPEPLAVAVLDTEVASREEDHIRTTLAQWQAAYSQLNASAAREVWPSVDVRALERAFQSLKSQALRFDHCDFTVTGARAQAACTGEAVYVPRVGNPSPKTNAREWNFELTRSDQRWTIASARSS
jgi:hypothetical protein